MMKIGDLIDVPTVKTVIELASVRENQPASAGEQQLLSEIAQTFVVTDDIKQNLESILQSIAANEGRGFFLSGSFGSGKSHFLAVLSLMMTYPSAWVPLVSQVPDFESLAQTINQSKYAVVQVPLLEYSARESLEVIIFDSIEKTLNRRWSFDLTLSEDEYFIEMFERYVLPACKSKIEIFIQEELGTQFNWQLLRSEPKDLIQLAQRFLAHSGEEIPFQLTPQRNAAVDKAMAALKNKDFSGIVILLDELSEFLKSKATAAQLNEDARFLQFIGERSLNQPIWIVGALQEAIEKTGDIQKAVFDKIKDRYRTRLELSTRHIRELIDRRLVKKNQSAPQAIKEAYTILKTSFNNINISEDVFFQIYPVHPECLEILDLSEGLFSQRRGVVDFVHFQLKGDPARHISGMLADGYLHLLTPDKIFDHFYIQIKESPRTNNFFIVYRDHFKKKIPEIFDAPADADCAAKIVKILILLEILPVKQTRNVQELANMILYRSTELSLGDINYEYFEEAILKRLEKELGYLTIEKREGKFQDIYRFDVASTTRDVIAERIKAYQSGVTGKHRELIETILPGIESPIFPWSRIFNIESHQTHIKWMNSTREGRVILSDMRDFDQAALTRIVNRIETTEDDFFVIFGFPFALNEQKETYNLLTKSAAMNRFRTGIICVLPTALSQPEWETLELYYSTSLAQEDFQKDNSESGVEIKERLNQEMKRLHRDVRLILETAYSDGLIYTASGRIEQPIREITDQNFDAILTRIINKPLENIYPLFHLIAPLEEISSFTVLKELLVQFIQPGGIEDLNHPQHRILRRAIDNIAVPLGIAEIKGRRCLLQGNTRYSTGLNAIYEHVDQEEPISYHELFINLRNSEYGMTRFIFDLMLMVLFRKGHLVPIRADQTLNPLQLQFPLFKYIDNVARGQLIAENLREKLFILGKSLLKEDLSDYDIQKQETVWAKLREFQERAGTFLEKVTLKLQLLKQKYSIHDEDVRHTSAALETLKVVAHNINRTLGSKPGLEKLLSNIEKPDRLRYSLEQMRVLNRFFENGLQQFEYIYNYIHNPQLFIPQTDSYQELQALVERLKVKLAINDNILLEDGLRYIKSVFDDFLDIYKSRYAQEHELLNRAIDLDKLIELQGISEFQLLARFSQISLISVRDDFNKIEKIIKTHEQRVCNQQVADTLDHFAQCRCGFKLGDPIKAVEIDFLNKLIRNGIRQYLTTLQLAEYRTQIENYLTNVKALQREAPAEQIASLLSIDAEMEWPTLLTRLEPQVTPPVITHLNKALAGDVVIVKRYINELYENLVDRKYTKDKIQQIVKEWLDGRDPLAQNVYVEISAKKDRE